MENEIILISLIQKGEEIKKGIYEVEFGHNFNDEIDFHTWKSPVKRFLSHNYGEDRSVSDFETAIEKFEKSFKSPNNFSTMLAVLKAIESIPQKIQKSVEKTAAKGINVNVTQSQQQIQSIQIFWRR